ncbi:hypothetical protein DFR29_10319 [Tahibacter aquaticus]|uniref:Uncharacterized protein n=1 Tax=Tahibacter aquaticus TaxID=520092 RepID=A0A4R6Z483_9GAMM|nr:hypothetical protein [Tahibacter aquaticus]TDR46488.1 hypothetical protein DFR29_10319 [Tahibacter aquaticus]
MKSLKRLALPLSRIAVLLFAFAATGVQAAPPAADNPILIDSASVEPLPGRDYSMRLDLAAARFEQIDAQSGEVHGRVFSAECAASLAEGLWLAVPAGEGRLDLLPLGATEAAATATAVAAGCRTLPSQGATLPPALVAQIAGSGGGVIFVDNSTLNNAGQVAAREVAR